MASRDPHDFYVTPPGVLSALLRVEPFPGTIWEPSCGSGDLVRQMREHGLPHVYATDLIDRGFGLGGVDFLSKTANHREFDHIITNPPYRLATNFADIANEWARYKVAMLLDLTFLSSSIRADFFERLPPARIWVFRQRITMYTPATLARRKEEARAGKRTRVAGGTRAFAWYVWDKTHKGRPTIDWLSLAEKHYAAMQDGLKVAAE
jgi:hypothetical protein